MCMLCRHQYGHQQKGNDCWKMLPFPPKPPRSYQSGMGNRKQTANVIWKSVLKCPRSLGQLRRGIPRLCRAAWRHAEFQLDTVIQNAMCSPPPGTVHSSTKVWKPISIFPLFFFMEWFPPKMGKRPQKRLLQSLQPCHSTASGDWRLGGNQAYRLRLAKATRSAQLWCVYSLTLYRRGAYKQSYPKGWGGEKERDQQNTPFKTVVRNL